MQLYLHKSSTLHYCPKYESALKIKCCSHFILFNFFCQIPFYNSMIIFHCVNRPDLIGKFCHLGHFCLFSITSVRSLNKGSLSRGKGSECHFCKWTPSYEFIDLVIWNSSSKFAAGQLAMFLLLVFYPKTWGHVKTMPKEVIESDYSVVLWPPQREKDSSAKLLMKRVPLFVSYLYPVFNDTISIYSESNISCFTT